jgi:hypothetical protein
MLARNSSTALQIFGTRLRRHRIVLLHEAATLRQNQLMLWSVRPELLQGIVFRPLAWATLAVCVGSAYAIVIGIRNRRERLACWDRPFCCSGF